MIILDVFKTKQCPYCAEYIKAAARKCRYCLSDLPAEPDQLAPSTGDAKPERAANAANDVEAQDSPPVSQITDDSPPPVDAFVALARHMRRAWRGDVPLWQAFWLYAFLPLGPFAVLTHGATAYALSHGGSQSLVWLVKALSILYFSLIFVVVWRSATNGKSHVVFATLAKVWIAVQCLYVVLDVERVMSYLAGDPSATEEVLIQSVAQMNNALPVHVDPYTILERVAVETDGDKPVLTYKYKLTESAVTRQWTQDDLGRELHFDVLVKSCKTAAVRDVLNRDVTMKHVYRDEWHTIGELVIRQTDCTGTGSEGAGDPVPIDDLPQLAIESALNAGKK